jgi:hypothetical protein
MPEVWCLVPESLEMLEWFAGKLGEKLEVVPRLLRRHFDWMPDLVVRLALLLAVADRLTGAQPMANIIGIDEMSRAILLGWWFVQEHYDALQWVLGTSPDSSVDDEPDTFGSTDGTDRIALEGMILERLSREGPLTRRELTRSFHKLPSRERDEVLRKLVREGKVGEMADLRIALTELGDQALTMSASA